MTELAKTAPGLMEKIESVLIKGDLASLTDVERLSYYRSVCESVGLNPLTKPFEYIPLNGRLTLYATKAATDQLRSVHRISVVITSREKIGDVYVVTARASAPDGRVDESTGVVALGKAYGDTLANLYMKAETKAKRRVTLSICGLGMLDETEVESIASQVRVVPKAIEASTSKMTPDASVAEATAVGEVVEATGEHTSTAVAEAHREENEGRRGLSEAQVRLWAVKTRGLSGVDLELIWKRAQADATNWKQMNNQQFNLCLALVDLAQALKTDSGRQSYNQVNEMKWYELDEREARSEAVKIRQG